MRYQKRPRCHRHCQALSTGSSPAHRSHRRNSAHHPPQPACQSPYRRSHRASTSCCRISSRTPSPDCHLNHSNARFHLHSASHKPQMKSSKLQSSSLLLPAESRFSFYFLISCLYSPFHFHTLIATFFSLSTFYCLLSLVLCDKLTVHLGTIPRSSDVILS